MRMTRKSRRQRQRREKLKKDFISIAKKGLGVAAAAMLFWSTCSDKTVSAMPTKGQVMAGMASITQNGNVMDITQTTNKAAINWWSFGIAANEKVNFNQPNANAITLNRVVGNNLSEIYGQMNANGKVFLINPNGILFGGGAQVNVGGLLATTHSISDADFMNGNYKFVSSDADGKVINQGTIIAENGGIVALLAPEAVNEGIIVAQKGTVAIASANQATFDFTGDGKMQLVVDESAVKALAENRGIIEADGGLVLMTASAQRELASAVVNQSGRVRAASLDGQVSLVELNAFGGTVNVAGTIDVSGAAAGAKGGVVDIFATGINLESSAKIDASGDTGGGTIRIGGDWQGIGGAPHADSVTIAKGADINADAITQGDGGTVVAWSDGVTRFDGSISAKGGQLGGDGGKVETSGHYLQIAEGAVNASAANGKAGEWLLDPYNITIDNSGGGLTISNTANSFVEAGNISSSLSSGTSVTLTTSDSGTSHGNITVNANITKSAGGDATLTLQAHDNIVISDGVQITTSGANTGKLNVDLYSDSDGDLGGGVTIGSGALIATNGGNFIIHGGLDGYANSTQHSTLAGYDHGVNIAGRVSTGGGSIEIYGSTNSQHSTDGGVMISGGLNSGTGEITIQGSGGSIATGIVLSSTGTIKGEKVNLIADKVNFSAGSQITGNSVTGNPTSAVLTINPLSVTSVNIGSGSGGLSLASRLFEGPGRVFENFSQINVGGSNSNGGTITVAGAVFDDAALKELVLTANTVTVGGDLTAAGKTVTVKTSNNSANSGKITASMLNLQGADFIFSNTANEAGALAGNVKSINFTNSAQFNVGVVGVAPKTLTIGGDSSLTALTGNVNIVNNIYSSAKADLNVEAKAGNVNLTNANINTAGGNITLLAKQAINMDNSKIGNIAPAADVKFKADAGLSMINNSAVSGTGTFNIAGYTPSTNIRFGSNSGSGGLFISRDTINSFTNGFSEIILGGSDSTGTIYIGDAGGIKDNLTVQTSGGITFVNGVGASLGTDSGKNLTLDAGSITFNDAALSSGKDLSINANSIDWGTLAGISTQTNGNLYIAPKTLSDIAIGRDAVGDFGYVNQHALTKIADGDFKNVTIGQNIAEDTTANKVTINEFTFTPTHYPTNLIIVGKDDAILNGPVIMNSDGYLAFKVNSLNQGSTAGRLTVKKLLLQGAGDFKFLNASNDIGDIAANVGALTLYNVGNNLKVTNVGGDISDGGIDGITTNGSTGEVTFITNRLSVEKNVDAKGELTIYSLTPNEAIYLGGTGPKDNSKFLLTADEISKLYGSKIIFGDKTLTNFTGNVYIQGNVPANTPLTFNSHVEIWTKDNSGGNGATGIVTLDGGTIDGTTTITTTDGIKMGTDGSKDLKITAYDFSNTSDLWLKDLNLTITKGLAGLGGKVHGYGGGKLTITNPNNDPASTFMDTYIVTPNDPNGPPANTGYILSYNMLNGIVEGFDGYNVISKRDIFLYGGSLTASLNLEADNDINVKGDVTIAGADSYLGAQAGGDFTIDAGKSLIATGTAAEIEIKAGEKISGSKFVMGDGSKLTVDAASAAKVEISAENTDLGKNAEINVGKGNFTLSTDKLMGSGINAIPAERAQILGVAGEGSLTLRQKGSDKTLYVGDSAFSAGYDATGLVITNQQLNGELFGNRFKSLILGNSSGTDTTKTVTINGLNVDNNVTIQTNATSKIEIGSGGLTVGTPTSNRTVTLKGGTIENNGNSINANNGTINFYADTLNLTGTGKVIGGTSSTIGLGSYNGTAAIYLGEGPSPGSAGLVLNDLLFKALGGFNHYNIGSNTQEHIYVNMGDISVFNLNKDTTLTAKDIAFNGNMNIKDNTLTINAVSQSNQTGGVITAAQLALLGKDHYLTNGNTNLSNKIGVLAANAQNIKVKSETLTIGEITPPGKSNLSGVTGTNVYLLATAQDMPPADPAAPFQSALTVTKQIKGDNVTLIADTMDFSGDGVVRWTGNGTGTLTVEQNSNGVLLGIGENTGANRQLEFGSRFFGTATTEGIFSKNFKTLILGKENSTADVVINNSTGKSVNFYNDNVIIRGKNVTIDKYSNIIVWSKTFEFMTKKLITKWGYSFNTGMHDFIISADEFDFEESTTGTQNGFFGIGTLTLRTYDLWRHLYLGDWGGSGPGTGLYLKSKYFYGISRVFQNEFSKIIIGQEDGNGTLHQGGNITFDTEVILRQGKKTTSGSITVNGTITTINKNFSIESRKVAIDGSNIDTGTGNMFLKADDLTITDDSIITGKGGRLFLDIYTPGTGIDFDGNNEDWFKDNRIFRGWFKSITLGSSGAGNVGVDGITIADGLTDELNVQGGGDVTINNVDTGTADLDVKAGKNVIIKKLTSNKVSAEAGTDGEISITDDSRFTKLGRIWAGKGITIKNKGHLTIEGEVTGGKKVDILTKDGDLTIDTNGSVESGSGSDIYLTAEGGHFINNNPGDSDDVLKPGTGGRWVIFTKNPEGDNYGKLDYKFRRYGTGYGNTNELTPPEGPDPDHLEQNISYNYEKNGIAYNDPATIKIYGENTYGDNYEMFFENGHYHIVFPDEAGRAVLDGNFWQWLKDNLLTSGAFSIGTTLLNGTPDATANGQYYGTPYVNKAGNLDVTYTGPNGLNYTVEIYLTVRPDYNHNTVGAVEDAKTLNSNNNGRLSPGITLSPFRFPLSPITDLTPPGTNAEIILQSGDSRLNGTFKNEGPGFALYFDYNEYDRGYAGNSRTLGAIPILFAQEGEQKLDAIYVINYNHSSGKLAILPAAQRVTTPDLEEVRSDANHEFSIHYQSASAGLFEVSHGNGIVSIKPLDDKALETLTSDEKSVIKAVLANGLLVGIQNIGVMPDQIRAVYIFLEK